MDKPILFSAPMVRALLDGRKMQTRRLLKSEPTELIDGFHKDLISGVEYYSIDHSTGHFVLPAKAVAFRPGDRLWCREAWRTTGAFEDLAPSVMNGSAIRIRYEADGFIDERGKSFNHFHPGRLRASIHMPRWASRLTLVVNDVRVERLKEISRDDAIAEGLMKVPAPQLAVEMGCNYGFDGSNLYGSPISAYAALWDHINGPGAWAANPWVAVYSFDVIQQNIDMIGGGNGQ